MEVYPIDKIHKKKFKNYLKEKRTRQATLYFQDCVDCSRIRKSAFEENIFAQELERVPLKKTFLMKYKHIN
jgi:hypothetical protein